MAGSDDAVAESRDLRRECRQRRRTRLALGVRVARARVELQSARQLVETPLERLVRAF